MLGRFASVPLTAEHTADENSNMGDQHLGWGSCRVFASHQPKTNYYYQLL